MSDKINIGIADDHLLVRSGFTSMLNRYKDINICFEVSNGEELLAGLKRHKTDIVLLDIEMPILGGVEVMPFLKSIFPNLKVIVISAHSEPGEIIKYVRLGAVSFLAKDDCDKETLIKAIYEVHKTGGFFDRKTTDLLSENGALPAVPIKERKLSPNETVVLGYICAGTSFKDIAELMSISVKTVRYYKRVLLIKTQCADIESLISYARENNLS